MFTSFVHTPHSPAWKIQVRVHGARPIPLNPVLALSIKETVEFVECNRFLCLPGEKEERCDAARENSQSHQYCPTPTTDYITQMHNYASKTPDFRPRGNSLVELRIKTNSEVT
jgi:hypothetical protein